MTKIAIFASGSGSNAERIFEYFKENPALRISGIYTNNPSAGVIARAQRLGVHCRIFSRQEFSQSDVLLKELQAEGVDFIILAGFLWLIPAAYVQAFPNKIVNIHPALLPKYGGKGMYGAKVHEAVVAAGEKESGITIHFVNEHYDEGQIIFQASCVLDENETADTLAAKIHELEYSHFPRIIEETILKS